MNIFLKLSTKILTIYRFALNKIEIVGPGEDSRLESTGQTLKVAVVDVEHHLGKQMR